MRASSRLRGALAAGALLVATLAVATGVLAHTSLVESSPADGAVLDAPPGEVFLRFSEPLVPAQSGAVIRDSSGQEVAQASVVPERPEAMLAPLQVLEPGTYSVEWSAVTADGVETTGTLRFTVRGSASVPAPATALASPSETVAATPSETVAATPAGTAAAPGPTRTAPAAVPSGVASPPADQTATPGLNLLLAAAVVVAGGALGFALARRRRR